MSKWSNVPISGTHDWDGDLKKPLDTDTADDAPLEVDWTDPDDIAAAREMVADAILPALANALQGIADPFADVPPVGRLAIIGGLSQVKPGEQRVRAALDLSSVGYKELAEQDGAVARTVTEARECGCGNLHPCGLADGSTLFADVEQGKPPEFRLAPWWQGEGDDE